MKEALFILFFVLSKELISRSEARSEELSSESESSEEMLVNAHKYCKQKTGASDFMIEASSFTMEHPGRKLKCYVACTLKYIGVLDEEGSITYEHIYDILPSDAQYLLDKLAGQCGQIVGEDICDTAWKTSKCYLEAYEFENKVDIK